eukprot:104062-Ditylum_brightwellii.AAC.1
MRLCQSEKAESSNTDAEHSNAAHKKNRDITVIILIIYDLLSDATEGKALKIPPAASEAAITAQFLSLIITVLTQDGVITVLEVADHGYHKDIMDSCPSAMCIKFTFSNFACSSE